MEIKKIRYEDVSPLKTVVKKERVTLENTAGCQWYGIFKDNKLVSFYAFVPRANSARFKSNYTMREHRRQGCLWELIQHAIRKCKIMGIGTLTAYCTEQSVRQHERAGAVRKWEKNGITFVTYHFEERG